MKKSSIKSKADTICSEIIGGADGPTAIFIAGKCKHSLFKQIFCLDWLQNKDKAKKIIVRCF